MRNDAFISRAFRVFAFNSVLTSVGVTISTTVDAVIIGNALGENGLAVLTVALSVYMLFNLLSFALGIGGSTMVAVLFGNEKKEEACGVFTYTLVIGLFFGAVIAALGLRYTDVIVNALGGGKLGSDANDYFSLILGAAPIFVVTPILNLMLRVDAEPKLPAAGIAVSAVVNLSLDILFIFGFGWGTGGAALAMVIGQAAALITYQAHFFKKKAQLKPSKFKPNLKLGGKIFFGGMSVASGYFYQGVYIFVFNIILAGIAGSDGIAIFATVFNAGMFAYAVFDGITLSLPSLVGTFLGERDIPGIRLVMRKAVRTCIVSALAVMVFLLIFAPQVVTMFGIGHLVEEGSRTLRIYALCVIFTSLNSVFAGYYQIIGETRLSAVINALRGFALILLFGVYLLPEQGVTALGFAFALSESAAFVVMLIWTFLIQKRRSLKSILLLDEDAAENLQIYETMLSGKMDNLSETADKVGDFCRENGIDEKRIYAINLTIEELACNIIHFGFSGDASNYISIKVIVDKSEVCVRLRDDAIDYNPFEHKSDNSDDIHMDYLGVTMIKQMAKRFDYRRSLIFNNLLIIL